MLSSKTKLKIAKQSLTNLIYLITIMDKKRNLNTSPWNATTWYGEGITKQKKTKKKHKKKKKQLNINLRKSVKTKHNYNIIYPATNYLTVYFQLLP